MGKMMEDMAETMELKGARIAEIRARVYRDGVVDPEEVETLFQLDEQSDRHDLEWTQLFCEALTDYLVFQQSPEGYISQSNAEWLVARISRDGMVKSDTELELLIRAMERAKSSPAFLSAFALEQVKKAVLQGEGPAACGRVLEPGRVGRVEAELVRRILYAFGGEGNVAVTRSEAEVLFDINDAVADADNDSAWVDLFTKAVANCLMAACGYQVPTRDTALRRETWLDEDSGGVANFLGRMVSGGFQGIFGAYSEPEDAWAERNAEQAAVQSEAEVITQEEADWLVTRIKRDGMIHENEKALLRFIGEESPVIHPKLKTLISEAA